MNRVFLLEDHASFREILALILGRESDLEVVGQAGSVTELRDVPSERWGEVDVAIVDLLLPDGASTEVIGEMREANPGLAGAGSGSDSSAAQATVRAPPEVCRRTRRPGLSYGF